jgi:hypothetical protein
MGERAAQGPPLQRCGQRGRSFRAGTTKHFRGELRFLGQKVWRCVHEDSGLAG